MQDAYLFPLLAAVSFLIVFSVIFGTRLRQLGFGFEGLLQRQIDYEERRKTPLGRKAHRPRLIRHAESPWYLLGLFLLPVIVNGGLLLALFWSDAFSLVPLVVVPLAAFEWVLGWWVQQGRVPAYQADYDEYLQLTADGNRCFDGIIIDQSATMDSLLTGGRLVTASQIGHRGRIGYLRLFVPFGTDQRFLVHRIGDEKVRIFYRPDTKPHPAMNVVVDGKLIGWHRRPQSRRMNPSYEELERRIAVN